MREFLQRRLTAEPQRAPRKRREFKSFSLRFLGVPAALRLIFILLLVFSRVFSSQKKSFHYIVEPMLSPDINSITDQIIGLAIKVHRMMGPGLLESVYVACLCYELKKAGLIIEREKMVPLFYEGIRLDQSYRLDLLIQQKIIVEIKAVENLTAIHKAQLLSYLKLTGCPVGLLINFNVELLKEGICRMVNNFSETAEFATYFT